MPSLFALQKALRGMDSTTPRCVQMTTIVSNTAGTSDLYATNKAAATTKAYTGEGRRTSAAGGVAGVPLTPLSPSFFLPVPAGGSTTLVAVAPGLFAQGH